MANQTVTTSVNYDSAAISGLLDGETITINGGTVTIDADVRWNQQAAVLGAVTLSSSLGGSLIIDGTKVWEIPFSASTGNVPTQAALGSNGVTGGTSGAAGELTRVWATGSLTPAAAGGAMPATGIIKLRSRVGNFQAGETITLPGGATVTASGAGRRSWIHVVGRAAASGSRITVPRLGAFSVDGDWYELGTTNGANNQTFQFPVADQCPAIWIETAAGSGQYDIWLNAADRWTDSSVATDDARGQYFGHNATTGVITIAQRAGNTAGVLPPSGCRVRIPNVLLSNALATDYATNTPPSGGVGQYGWSTTSGAGSIVLHNAVCNWFASFSNPFLIDIRDSAIAIQLAASNIGTTVTLANVGIGQTGSGGISPLSIATAYGGGTLTDVRVARRATANAAGTVSLTDTADYTLTRVRSETFGLSGTNAYGAGGTPTSSAFRIVRAINTTLIDCTAIGAVGIDATPAFGLRLTGLRYACRTIGTTNGAVDLFFAITVSGGSTDVVVDGFEAFSGVANVHPYSGIVSASSGVSTIEVRNIGTPSAPYDCGTSNPSGVLVSASSSRNVIVRRCYAVNTRTSPFSTANTVQGFQAYNIWGDAADSQANAAINSTVRGGRYTQSTTGQTAVYGTHWSDNWTSTTAGQIVISCNEPTPDTAAQCSATLNTSAGSGFTATGSVAMTQLSDTVEWTQPYYVRGVTGFANTAPAITGTNVSNHTLQFQWDAGAGWNGTWLTLNAANLSGVGAIDPATGVRLRVRVTVATANANNLLTYISVATTTNSTAQQTEYPLPGSLVTISGLVQQSRVKLTRIDTGALLAQASNGAGTTVDFDVTYEGAVAIEARNASTSPSYRPWLTQTTISPSAPTTVIALQEAD